jgi:predicted signal transduction protein with EAL and GGDEF domain
MTVKGYLALLVGVFVVALLVVTLALGSLVDDRAGAWGLTVLLPLLVTLAGVAVAVALIRLVLRDIARPFHSAGAYIRSNADQLSTAVQRLAATTAEQSSGVAQTSATMEELARAAASIAETVDHVATQADTTRNNLEQAQFDIRASGERTLALADRVGEVGVTIALINEIADQTNLLALRALAERLRLAARAGDVPGRWGGEEFLVALPATSAAEAAGLGERVRREIAAAPVSLEDGPLHVTASIGVASGAEDGWEGLVRRADTGLYAAKEGGRDRVVAGPSSHRGTAPAAAVESRTPGRENAAR